MRNYFTIVLLITFYYGFSQPKVKYDKDFEFTEGIYLTYDQLRHNAPISKSSIISNQDKNELNFLSKELLKNKIDYIDSLGNKHRVKTSSIWGYSSNNIVYINFEEEFTRIPIIGSICHFTAIVTVYNEMYDTYSYDMRGFSTRELRQLILDFETGKITSYTIENLELILAGDRQLYEEFTSLKRKKKRNSMFIYLRKYNEKHPLYFTSP